MSEIKTNIKIIKGRLHRLEIDLTNRCNLNCAYCSHFSPLAKNNLMDYNLETFKQDIKELSSKVIIGEIRLLGGEPFLVHNLLDYVNVIRSYYGNIRIIVVSNGVLENRINQLLPELNRLNVKIYTSTYPEESKFIVDEIGSYRVHSFRNLGLSLLPKNEKYELAHELCSSKICIHLYDGRLFLCPIMKNLETLEKTFNLDFNIKLDERSIDIYTHTGEELQAFISDKMTLKACCSHCPTHWKSFK